MLNASYNLSFRLNEFLSKIELQRHEVLLAPIPPKKKLQLRWLAIVDHIYCSLVLDDDPLKKSEIVKLITAQGKKKLKQSEREVVKYKEALDYIKQNWLVCQNLVTPKTILTLYDLACYGKLKVPISNLADLLHYIQARPLENPIIQAGIANIELMKMQAFTNDNGRITRLVTLLFLYKYGYDFEGFLVLEKYWAQNPEELRDNFQIASHASSITLWLEYFAKCVTVQLAEVIKSIKESSVELPEMPTSFWEINDRQKSILNSLEEPSARITNKKVQKMFKISQITASRDLAKLKALGLLATFGKGRSIYYIKN